MEGCRGKRSWHHTVQTARRHQFPGTSDKPASCYSSCFPRIFLRAVELQGRVDSVHPWPQLTEGVTTSQDMKPSECPSELLSKCPEDFGARTGQTPDISRVSEVDGRVPPQLPTFPLSGEERTHVGSHSWAWNSEAAELSSQTPPKAPVVSAGGRESLSPILVSELQAPSPE